MKKEELVLLKRDERYPLDLPAQEGAVAELLRKGQNTVIVAMPDIDKNEAWALRKGTMKCGFLAKNSAILLLWQFYGKKNELCLTIDSPFDARLIPSVDLDLYSIANDKERLAINVIAVDTSSQKTVGIRLVTMSHDLTVSFLASVQDQLAAHQASERQLQQWMLSQSEQLTAQTKMYEMGV